MIYYKTGILILALMYTSIVLGEVKKDIAPPNEVEKELEQFGFGPALYLIRYNEEILKDTKDIHKRGDDTLSVSGSRYSTTVGLEIHYNFTINSFKYRATETKAWTSSSGMVVSPFVGLFDFDNGINGMAYGLLFGYWRGDGEFKNKKSLNISLGRIIHKNRLVLASGVTEGLALPTGLTEDDSTEREDVSGVTLMISGSVGF